MINLHGLSLSRGKKQLLRDVSLSLYPKQKIGLVGHNGCGKSSFLKLLTGAISPDQGECHLPQQLTISHLSQDLPHSQLSAIDFVLSGDNQYWALQHKLKQADLEQDNKTMVRCHQEMEESNAYAKPARAATILAGLGFENQAQQNSVQSFSGGWRMRLNLARCLMKPAELLLLDEPTNHLDLEAIYWLERFLKQSPATIIMVAHDRDFLDQCASHILHFEQQTASLYKGNYSQFEKTRAEQLALQQAAFEKQQKKMQHMMSFVTRFKAKASKAKQAKSRLKSIERMTVIAQAQLDSPFLFEFYPCPKASAPLIDCKDLAIGYPEHPAIIEHINFQINPGDRLAFLGPNGQGKSTLIKTLIGKLPPLGGKLQYNKNLRSAYFAQDLVQELHCEQSPVQMIQALSPSAKDQEIRNFLGGFAFHADTATNPCPHFSGGEKARLALALLVWQKPNLLLLDEPNNHFDIDMRSAIELALQQYEGAMILISHDRHMLNSVSDSFYLIFNRRLQPFSGDVSDYYQWLQSKKQSTNNAETKNAKLSNNKERKATQNRIKKLEQQIEDQQLALEQIEQQLADNQNYQTANQQLLDNLIAQQQSISQTLSKLEDEWLALHEFLENQ